MSQVTKVAAGFLPETLQFLRLRASRCVAWSLSLSLHVLVLAMIVTALAVQTASRSPAQAYQPMVAFLLDIEAQSRAINTAPPPLHGELTEPFLEVTAAPPPELDFEPIAADSFDAAEQIETAADAERVRELQGIYARQLDARIQRLLEVRGLLEPQRSCLVTMTQDEQGFVIDVDTSTCAMPMPERERLRDAILAASPMPRPPAGLAMGSYLTFELGRSVRDETSGSTDTDVGKTGT